MPIFFVYMGYKVDLSYFTDTTILGLAGGLIVYSAFLVYLDPLLTAVILLIVLLSSVFFYGLSLQASRLLPARPL